MKILNIFFIILFFFSCNSKLLKPPQTLNNRYKWLRIVFTGDINGKFYSKIDKKNIKNGGLSLLTSAIQNLKNDSKKLNRPFLLLDSGDIFNANIYNNDRKSNLGIKFLNYNKFDVIVPGNHEFDKGIKSFKTVSNKIKTDIICANIKTNYDFKPYVLKNVNGIKVGIIGLITEHLSQIIPYRYIDEFKVSSYKIIKKYVNELKSNGADIVVVLSHRGFDTKYPEKSPDYKLAEKISDIDLIISGHREKGTTNKYLHPNGKTYICSSYGGSSSIGKIDMMIDVIKGSIIRFNQILLPVNNKIYSFSDQIKDFKIEGKDTFFIKVGYFKSLNQESFTQAFVLNTLQKIYKTDFALINKNSVRDNLNKGLNKILMLEEVVPFQNYPVIIQLKGDLLDKLRTYNKYLISKKKIDVSKVYTVVTTDYCLNKLIKNKIFPELKVKKNSNEIVSEVLKSYLMKKNIEFYY